MSTLLGIGSSLLSLSCLVLLSSSFERPLGSPFPPSLVFLAFLLFFWWRFLGSFSHNYAIFKILVDVSGLPSHGGKKFIVSGSKLAPPFLSS